MCSIFFIQVSNFKFQFTSLSNENQNPLKSGEIFRDNMGKFSFLCMYCNFVRENCKEIMDHINSHFDGDSSFTHDAEMPTSLPEFISVDQLEPETKMEITSNDNSEELGSPIRQPKLINAPSILKTKFEMPKKDGCRSDDRIVRIIKLKPIKFRPRKVIGRENIKLLSKNDHKSGLTKPTVLPKIETPIEMQDSSQSELEPAAHESDSKSTICIDNEEMNHTENKIQLHVRHINQLKSSGVFRSKEMNHTGNNEQIYVRQNRSRCYQCEMQLKIHNPSLPKRHICAICTTWFPNHAELEAHTKKIHNKYANDEVCNAYFCYICEKKFQSRNKLVNHIYVHNENSEHLCATCGRTYKSLHGLREHMKTHEERKFECDECGKVFRRFDRLRNHFWCHSKDLTFVCKICSKGFKMKRYLHRHMAVHNDPKINCRFCDASFNFATVRNYHEKSRHNVV